MADFNFIPTLNDIGTELVNLETNTIKAILCTADYVALMTHHFLSDVPSGARVAVATLTGQSFVDGIFDADNTNFTGMSSGDDVTQLVLYVDDGGSPEGGRLLRRVSNPNYVNFPFTSNGLDVLIQWPNDGNKIFAYVNS